jgi:23S rRNA pseudouridine1911/1915/1917 synthase
VTAGPSGESGTAAARHEEVPPELAGERLDVALSRLFGISRTTAADLVAARHVLVDGRQGAKSDRLAEGAHLSVRLTLPAEAGTPPTAAIVPGLRILFCDDDIAVIDKPVGVAAHPSPGWDGPTVLGHFAASGITLARSGPDERAGIVHRLDVGTSGVMVLARSESAYRLLKEAFAERTVDKTYHALVQGHPDPSTGTIDAPIGRHPHADYKMAVVAGGRDSITHYRTLSAHRFASLLEVELETGRTHQIRVHMAAVDHPCVGDLTYGADPVLAERLGLTRQWLHAVRLGFAHPTTREQVSFVSAYPEDLQFALDRVADVSSTHP